MCRSLHFEGKLTDEAADVQEKAQPWTAELRLKID